MKRRSSEWRELVEAWLASGLSRDEFACMHGVRSVTLGWWRWRLQLGVACPPESSPATSEVAASEVATPEGPAFVDVVLVSDAVVVPEFVLEIGQVRVRVAAGFDADELRRLVGALC